MAKVIKSDVQSRVISDYYPIGKIILIGVASGLVFWLFTMLIQKYIIDPAFCHSAADTLTCLNSLSISGNIAMIIVAIIGTIVMVLSRMIQPLIMAVTTAATIWGLAWWTGGLSTIEIIIWSVLTYTLAYILYSWIARYNRTGLALILALIVIMVVRIVVNS
jgi:hypothetical protein